MIIKKAFPDTFFYKYNLDLSKTYSVNINYININHINEFDI